MPISQMKVRSIADAAGCSRTTFYKYFDSVYDLQEQAQQQVANEMGSYLENNYKNFNMNDDVAMHESAIKTYKTYGKKVCLLLGSFVSSTFIKELCKTMRPTIAKMYNFNVNNEEDEFKLNAMTISMMMVFAFWEQEGEPISADELADTIIDLVTATVAHYNPKENSPAVPEDE